MSFILDALKKSDHKRQVNTAPKLDTVHDVPPPQKSHRKRSTLILLVLLVLVLNVGFLFWFVPPAQESPVEKLPIVQQQSAPPAERLKVERAKPVAVQAEKAEVKVSLPEPAKEPAKKLPAAESTGVLSAADPPANRTYAIDELPGSIRSGLPEMHMSLHAFSEEDGTASLVRINDHIMREGAMLAGKYLLEEITADGAVFSYRGYRFVLPRKSI